MARDSGAPVSDRHRGPQGRETPQRTTLTARAVQVQQVPSVPSVLISDPSVEITAFWSCSASPDFTYHSQRAPVGISDPGLAFLRVAADGVIHAGRIEPRLPQAPLGRPYLAGRPDLHADMVDRRSLVALEKHELERRGRRWRHSRSRASPSPAASRTSASRSQSLSRGSSHSGRVEVGTPASSVAWAEGTPVQHSAVRKVIRRVMAAKSGRDRTSRPRCSCSTRPARVRQTNLWARVEAGLPSVRTTTPTVTPAAPALHQQPVKAQPCPTAERGKDSSPPVPR